MVLSVPFDRPGQFYFSQKIHGMRADGTVQLGTQALRLSLGGLLRYPGLGAGGMDLP